MKYTVECQMSKNSRKRDKHRMVTSGKEDT